MLPKQEIASGTAVPAMLARMPSVQFVEEIAKGKRVKDVYTASPKYMLQCAADAFYAVTPGKDYKTAKMLSRSQLDRVLDVLIELAPEIYRDGESTAEFLEAERHRDAVKTIGMPRSTNPASLATFR